MRRHVALVVGVVAMLTAPGAAADQAPASAVSSVSVARSGDTLTVEGVAAFADASDTVVATDPTGDVSPGGVGLDLTQARIRRPQGGDSIVFTATVADPLPEPVFTAPEVTHYLWWIRVTNAGVSQNYQLMAMRSGQYNRTVPYPDYLFRVNACGKTATGNPSCFTVAGVVDGRMADGVIEWTVPAGLIGALPGAVIDVPVSPSATYGVEANLGVSGFTYLRESERSDAAAVAPYAVGQSVSVGIRRANAKPETVVYATPATVGPDGTFVAKLATPKVQGDYVVSVRACHGAIAGCGYAQAPVTVL